MKQFIFSITFIIVGLIVCLMCDANGKSSAQFSSSKKMRLQAVLYTEDQEWQRGAPLRLTFYIINRSDIPVYVDGRMHWPGILNVIVLLPSGKKISVLTLHVKIPLAADKDMISLQPGRLYGAEITISPDEKYLIPEIRDPVRGRYEFLVAYYSPGDRTRQNKLALESNSVVLQVR